MAKSAINKEDIITIQKGINSGAIHPTNVSDTKQQLVLRFLSDLGYNIFSDEIRVANDLNQYSDYSDYIIVLNNTELVRISCKTLGEVLSDRHIMQLHTHCNPFNIKIAILTDGNEYKFFTNSESKNNMDLKPYYSFKISEMSKEEIDDLKYYSKKQIRNFDNIANIKEKLVIDECTKIVENIRFRQVPPILTGALKEKFPDIEVSFIKDTLQKQLIEQLGEFAMDKVKINHEYVYNDYSDGDWTGHKIKYAIIFNTRYDYLTMKELLITVITEILDRGFTTRHNLLTSNEFLRKYRINSVDIFEKSEYISKYDLYIEADYSSKKVIEFIEKLLRFANLQDNSILLSFV